MGESKVFAGQFPFDSSYSASKPSNIFTHFDLLASEFHRLEYSAEDSITVENIKLLPNTEKRKRRKG